MNSHAAAIAYPTPIFAAAQRASCVVLAALLLFAAFTQYQILARYDGSGAVMGRTVYGARLDEPVLEVSGTGVKTYLHGDGLGSVVVVTTSGGAVQAIKAYGPYGECANAGAASLWGYAGRLYDPETGLYDNRARAYSTAQGRFLQPDPIGTQGGMNLYAYVNNDPLNLTDPSGLCAASFGGGFASSFTFNPQQDVNVDWSNGWNLASYTAGAAAGIATNVGLSLAGAGARTAMAVEKAGIIPASRALVPYHPSNNGLIGEAKDIVLQAGTVIDRYGAATGRFFSPVGTPIEMRSLSPMQMTRAYNQYEVVKPFQVEAGFTAPAYGQPGTGIQYRSNTPAADLLANGFIKKVGQ